MEASKPQISPPEPTTAHTYLWKNGNIDIKELLDHFHHLLLQQESKYDLNRHFQFYAGQAQNALLDHPETVPTSALVWLLEQAFVPRLASLRVSVKKRAVLQQIIEEAKNPEWASDSQSRISNMYWQGVRDEELGVADVRYQINSMVAGKESGLLALWEKLHEKLDRIVGGVGASEEDRKEEEKEEESILGRQWKAIDNTLSRLTPYAEREREMGNM